MSLQIPIALEAFPGALTKLFKMTKTQLQNDSKNDPYADPLQANKQYVSVNSVESVTLGPSAGNGLLFFLFRNYFF